MTVSARSFGGAWTLPLLRVAVMVALLGTPLVFPASASADFFCTWVTYQQDIGAPINRYECFDSAEVSTGPIYVDTNGWWGPVGGPYNPPPVPQRFPGDPPGPNVQITITYVNIGDNRVEVSLIGDSGGTLRLEAVRDNNSTFQLAVEQINAGPHTYSHRAQDLPSGKYKWVRAKYAINGAEFTHQIASEFDVKGQWEHSQYVTVWERSCVDNREWAEINCPAAPAIMARSFQNQAWLNGSGMSKDYGAIQLAWQCLPQHNEPAWGRRFAQVSSFQGSCGGSLDGNTLASGDFVNNDRPRDCDRWVLIVGVGVKQVRDRCPACRDNGNQYDNFKEGQSSNCGVREVNLGSYQTIMLP